MYMYYLLGHRLMDSQELDPIQKDIVAKNTYILALDGDIDFQVMKRTHFLHFHVEKSFSLVIST